MPTRLRVAPFMLPLSVFVLTNVTDVHAAIAQSGPAMVREVQAAPAAVQVGFAMVQGAPAMVQGAPATVQVGFAMVQRAPAMVQRAPAMVQRAPAMVQGGFAMVQGAPAMVVLVRHAEKAATGGADPSLSEVGQTRAKALVTALNDAGVSAVITTQYKRTSETGDAVATARTLKTEKIPIAGTTAAHIDAVVAAIRQHPGEVVLVVGHSNTIPAIVTALGGPKMPDLCDANYATMFILRPGKDGTPAQVVRTRYGASEPDGAEMCATSTRK